MRVQSPKRLLPESLRVAEDLDAGEWQSISLAIETKAAALFLDDRGAVTFARSLDLPVLTTPLLLLNAKTAGLIPSVRERLDALRATGFWLKDDDYLTILTVAGEQGKS